MPSYAQDRARPSEAGAEPTVSGSSAPPSLQAQADIVAITTRDDFLLELGAVLGTQAAVHPVESLSIALEHIAVSRRAHILVFDTRGMADLRNCIGRAFARAPNAVILLFAHAADEEGLRRAFKGSKVFAILPMPIDSPRTSLAFADALTDALARNHPAPAIKTAPVIALASAVPSKDRWGIGACLAVLVVACSWFIARDRTAAPSAARPARSVAAVQPSLRNVRADEMLEKARAAMSEKRYTEPADASALLYYRSALAADPANAEALDGLTRVAALLIERFDENLRQSNPDAAAATLAIFKSAAPKDARTGALESRLMAAQDAAARDQTESRSAPPTDGPAAQPR